MEAPERKRATCARRFVYRTVDPGKCGGYLLRVDRKGGVPAADVRLSTNASDRPHCDRSDVRGLLFWRPISPKGISHSLHRNPPSVFHLPDCDRLRRCARSIECAPATRMERDGLDSIP